MKRLVKCFEDLVAWQQAIDLAVVVYEASGAQSFRRDFRLRDQIRGSATSVSSNIAEGFERSSRAEFRYFLSVAKGSCGEVRSQLHLAHRLGYLTPEHHEMCIAQTNEVSRKIGKLRSSIIVTRKGKPAN